MVTIPIPDRATSPAQVIAAGAARAAELGYDSCHDQIIISALIDSYCTGSPSAARRGWQEYVGAHPEHWALICEQMTRVAAHGTGAPSW